MHPNMNGPPSGGNSVDACISIVHSLMCHRQGGDSESFARKAIECLVKKLKDKPEELDALIQAITTNGASPGSCATIPRTLDGRLQVAGKKVFPHVIYARIWRWADIQKSELKHEMHCQFAFDLKLDNVCVNPYHYRRESVAGDYAHMTSHFGLDLGHGPYDGQRSPQPTLFTISDLNPDLGPRALPPPPFYPGPPNGPEMLPRGHPFPPGLPPPPPRFAPFNGHPPMPMDSQPPPAYTVQPAPPQPRPPFNGMPRNGLSEFDDPFVVQERERIKEQSFRNVFRSQPPPEYWCGITYFELTEQVGEVFKVRRAYNSVTIDGFSDPGHSNRFCLGPLTNVHRTDASEKTRLLIGKGISLHRVQTDSDETVYLEVFGTGEENSYSVFVQSNYLDRERGLQPGATAVHKVHAFSGKLKIFDLRSCYYQMINQIEDAQMQVQAQVAAVTGRPSMSPTQMGYPGIGADALRNLCVVRLSFAKGWGADYNRKSIKETPCWLEVQMNHALQVLDFVLRNTPSNEPKNMTDYC